MGCFDIFLLQGSAFTPHFKEKKLNWQISATRSGYWPGCIPEKPNENRCCRWRITIMSGKIRANKIPFRKYSNSFAKERVSMPYFWTFESDLPSDMGVETFSLAHIVVLSLSAIIIYFIIQLYRKQADFGRRNIKMTIVSLLIMLYFSRWIWCAFFGDFSFFINLLLPLHLCSVSAIMGTAAVFSNNRLLQEFIYGISLPGGLVAMANPNLGPYPLLSFNFVEYTLTHLLLILLPLLFVFGDGFRPDIKSLPHSIYLAAPFIGIAFLVNQTIGSNYMFLNQIETGTILVLFDKWLGTPGYLIAVLGSIFIVWAILYAPWEISRRRNFSG